MILEYGAKEQAPREVIVAHNGALGDFLCCWPGMLTIARHFAPAAVHAPLYFMGRESRLPWLAPLGYAPCPLELQKALESLYISERLPESLKSSTIFWFCLDKLPKLPALQQNPERIIPLPLLLSHNLEQVIISAPHVLLTLKAHLKRLGLAWPQNCRQAWQSLFGGWQGQWAKEIALLPGSGHKYKEWPLQHFVNLADRLTAQGWKPLFIIGETELERGLIPPPEHKYESPSPPDVLAERLRKVRAVVSNDAGPAHLAGLYGIPGLVLFGPTPPATWGVPGLANISQCGLHTFEPQLAREYADAQGPMLFFENNFTEKLPAPLPCSPCAVMPKDIDCPAPLCLESLSPDLIFNILSELLRVSA